jgi:hypothetical protein
MKNVLDDRTIVLVGSWNVAILNPDWVARELFGVDTVEAQILIAEGQTSLKYKVDNVSISPQPSRVIVASLATTDECLQQSECIAARLLERLPVTPVTAIGVNFGYVEEQIPENIAGIFNTHDIALFGQRKLQVKQVNLVRHLAYEDRELRFRLSKTEQNTLRIHLNYHKVVPSATEGKASILGKSVPFRAASEQLLRELYNLELEIEE